jgi:hypothetical protein
MLCVFMLCVLMLPVIMLCDFKLSVIMLSFVMEKIVMLIVVMQSVVMLQQLLRKLPLQNKIRSLYKHFFKTSWLLSLYHPTASGQGSGVEVPGSGGSRT